MFPAIGLQEMLVIMVVILLVFGPKKIPELARGIGKGMKEFQKAADEVKKEMDL